MAFKNKKPKFANDPYAGLDSDWKDAVDQESTEANFKRLAMVTLNEEDNQRIREADLQLAEVQANKAKLAAPYSAVSKMNAKRIRSLERLLRDPLAKISKDEILKQIANAVLAEEQNQTDKSDDIDLAAAIEQVKTAEEGYGDATTANKLRIKYVMMTLKNKGKA